MVRTALFAADTVSRIRRRKFTCSTTSASDSVVRGSFITFTVWLSASDRRTEVPPAGLLPGRYRRQRPYIYSDAEIENLVQAAGRLPSATGLKGRTLSTIFGLLAVTGLRVTRAITVADGEIVDEIRN